MKRVLAMLALTTFPVLAAVTVVSFAQQPQPATPDNIVVKQRVIQGQEGGVPAPPPGDFVFVMSEMNFSGKVVKNAPYSAQAVTETIQTLSDGNRIANRTTSSQYRDSEGRTRREQSIKILGSLGDSGEPLQTIFINDPVAVVSYTLDSRTHVAHKTSPFTLKVPPGAQVGPLPSGGGEGQRFEFKVEGPPPTAGVVKVAPSIAGAAVAGEGGHVFNIQTETAGQTFVFRRTGSPDNLKEEQLGKQLFDGVEADGVRTTITIPAGEIGNERPIEIVSERWYSTELQMVVMTRHSDPRTGETTYRLNNISRTEPAKTLFEVPADYTVKEGMPGAPGIMTLPTRVRKPAPE